MFGLLQFACRGHDLFQGEVQVGAAAAGQLLALHTVGFTQGQPFQLGRLDEVAGRSTQPDHLRT
jgi:hypothetical protein